MILNSESLTIEMVRESIDRFVNEIGGLPSPRPYKPVYRLAPCMPVKKHIKKKRMKDSYHNRIQKKWDKRFGLKHSDKILDTPQGYFVPEPIYIQNRELMNFLQGLNL